jgi:diadenosine tetraphosphate (Ap4A) HIT family hydrolase
VDELFDLPAKELNKFGQATKLLKRKKRKSIPSSLFSRLFSV